MVSFALTILTFFRKQSLSKSSY